jgi:hypothetical protein
MASTWLKREINTGSLEVGGARLKVRVNRRASVSPMREWDEVAANCSSYRNSREISFAGLRTGRGIVAKEIARALKSGHKVTAQTDKLGETSFSRVGPVVLGWSERQSLESVSIFGLKKVIGAPQSEVSAALEQPEAQNLPAGS